MNVVLIETDQLSARWLGCYGNPAAHTPHLDALAARGVRFDRCFANQPVCMASRASTMTGRGPQHHGVYYNRYELGLDLPTYAQVLRAGGVQTLGVGKFHLECHGRSAYNDVTKYGFERAEVTEDIRAGDWLDWVEREHPECYDQALATVWEMPHLSDYGPRHRDLNAEIRAARARHPAQVCAALTWPSVVPEAACQTTWVVDRAIACLDARDRRRPFFLKASFVDPHDPYDPPARWLDAIDPARIPAPVVDDDASLSALRRRFDAVPFLQRFAKVDLEEWRRIRHHYLASLAFVDAQVGRLLAWLEAEGLRDDTVVVFTADHGDAMGDHGYPVKGAWHFDACVRVPLIVAGPGVAPGRTVPTAVSNLDWFPTVTDIAGIACEVPLEGVSLWPLLRGQGDRLDRLDAVLVESYSSYAHMDPRLRAWTVATPTHRYTRYGDGFAMLFDTDADPDERVNLCGRDAALEQRLMGQFLDVQARRYEPLSGRGRHPTALH